MVKGTAHIRQFRDGEEEKSTDRAKNRWQLSGVTRKDKIKNEYTRGTAHVKQFED